MTNDFPGEGPRCSCPKGQAGILTSGKCACAPLPAGPVAHVPLSKKAEEKDDTPAERTDDLEGSSDLEERSVNCAFKITCPYMQHAVRQNGVCTCVPQRTKEKRDTAESTLPDEQPRRPAAPCALEINCPYMQHAVRQNGACTCIPVRSKEKRSIVERSQHGSVRHYNCEHTECRAGTRPAMDNYGKCGCVSTHIRKERDTVESSLHDKRHQHQAPSGCAAMKCPKNFFVSQFGSDCKCLPLVFLNKRGSAALDDLDHED